MPEDLTDVRVVAPLRCCEVVTNGLYRVCGEAARWMRASSCAVPLGYFCDTHRRPIDLRIPDAFLFRRVTVSLDAVFTGASFVPTEAHAEAFDRLIRGVEGAGGLVNLHGTESRLCRYAGQLPASVANAGARRR